MATYQSETAIPVAQGEKPANRYPENHLPFVCRSEVEGGINLWGVPPRPDYDEAWHEGEYRAIVLLNAIADNRYRGPDVLRRIAYDQVRAGLETPGHKGAVLGFWDTVAQLIIPCLNPDNVARLAAQIVARRCASMANSTIGAIELKAEYRRIALKAAATRRARVGKAVRKCGQSIWMSSAGTLLRRKPSLRSLLSPSKGPARTFRRRRCGGHCTPRPTSSEPVLRSLTATRLRQRGAEGQCSPSKQTALAGRDGRRPHL